MEVTLNPARAEVLRAASLSVATAMTLCGLRRDALPPGTPPFAGPLSQPPTRRASHRAHARGVLDALQRAAGDPWMAAVAGARAAAMRAAQRAGGPVEVALVLGDLHAEHVALGHALAHFGGAVDAVLSVGDVVDGDAARCDAQRTVDLLVEAGAVGVAGNHDRWWLGGGADLPDATPQGAVSGRALKWLRALPRWRWVETVAGRAALAHGFGDDDMARVHPGTSPTWARRQRAWPTLAAGDAKFHIGGHTHQHFVQVLPGDVGGPPLTLINAGTLQRGRGGPVIACVDFLRRVARFYAVLPGGAPAASPDVTATF